MPITIQCQGCGSSFEASRISKIWCDDCNKARRKVWQAQYDHHQKEPCPNCGEPMVKRASLCRACDNRARTIRHLGENNPNWRQGRITDPSGYVLVRVSA